MSQEAVSWLIVGISLRSVGCDNALSRSFSLFQLFKVIVYLFSLLRPNFHPSPVQSAFSLDAYGYVLSSLGVCLIGPRAALTLPSSFLSLDLQITCLSSCLLYDSFSLFSFPSSLTMFPDLADASSAFLIFSLSALLWLPRKAHGLPVLLLMISVTPHRWMTFRTLCLVLSSDVSISVFIVEYKMFQLWLFF